MTLAAAWFAVAATAGGTHAGGHGHDESAIGQPGQAAKVSRTVQVEMADTMRFTPANFAVKQGETIRFVVKNSGQLKHEFVLGTAKELKDHYQVMKKFPGMEHADANMLSVAPGQTGEVIWQFSKAGPVDFACLQPGHFDAGMKGLIKVAADKASSNDMTQGEIRKIDKDAKKITIKHGEIKNLEMPPMTMVFQVRDLALLEKVRAGDKVQFKAMKDSGALMVTDLQPLR